MSSIINNHFSSTHFLRFCSIWLIFTLANAVSANTELPSIGEAGPSLSAVEEQQLGQTWLRMFRRQVPTSADPIVIEYTENLLNHLARYNPDAGKDFSLVVVKNNSLNAFAVPGGIIGVHTGLFDYAKTEGQFASVIAHELAHLSQRHYARGVEKQKGQQVFGMAALLASFVLAATSGGDAGIAAIQATRASIIDQQLRFSRSFEQEADRIGMQTLIAAGFDPHQMSQMFEQMQRASRFSSEPPEFLLTHPITAKRIADTKNRARDYPDQFSNSSLEYDLVRVRAIFNQEVIVQQAISRFESELKGFSPSKEASRYGLALALLKDKQFTKANKTLEILRQEHPDNDAILITQSNIEAGLNNMAKAEGLVKQALERNPDAYAMNIQYSRLLASNNNYRGAVKVLDKLRKRRPEDPYLWFHLAELAGLAGDILMLHKARAEYFILYGDFDRAEIQLKHLLKKFPEDKVETAIAKQRLIDIKQLKKSARL